jgi:hypothetical protein
MEEHKTGKPAMPAGKYFKYAIGEIILVVIGILIALQINNWNESKKDRTIERETLISLKSDLESAMLQLDFKISQNENYKMMDSLLLDVIHFNKKIPIDSLESLMLKHIFTPGFDPELGTLNEILSTGKMTYIRNRDLRNYISTWNKYMDELNEVDSKLLYFDFEIKTPMYTKLLPMKNNLNTSTSFGKATATDYPKSNYNWDPTTVLTSLEFENMLTNYIIYGNIQHIRLLDIKTNMTDMVAIITKEVKND